MGGDNLNPNLDFKHIILFEFFGPNFNLKEFLNCCTKQNTSLSHLWILGRFSLFECFLLLKMNFVAVISDQRTMRHVCLSCCSSSLRSSALLSSQDIQLPQNLHLVWLLEIQSRTLNTPIGP